ncbi:MAG: UvrD-helicase domain-containing protein [Bifidobacteriaceae bacterium]|jgi:DNA helicase-2/ATP-dependent DNA helicase PcrA|nr:UvrD-helicase domain-containing protein [Bifidobacteriaceae bacterium]
MPHQILAQLNAQQTAAVTDEHDELLILAGAGSGKTRTLTHRIAWFLEQKKAKPFEILAICFTNKAANELKKRMVSMVGNLADSMQVSTFHSACLRILRTEAPVLDFLHNFSIYDEVDSKRLLGEILEAQDIDPKRFSPSAFKHQISLLKNHLITPGEYIESLETKNRYSVEYLTTRVYPEYMQRLKANHALDFDDILYYTAQLLTTNNEVHAHYYHRFKHIFVDEYQDTNRAQYVIVRALHVPPADLGPIKVQHTLTVVGDSDQSIYKFRGSNVRNIMDFERDFPKANTLVLAQNYRSLQPILDVANQVIQPNFSIHKKELVADRSGGQLVEINHFDTDLAEAESIANELERSSDLADTVILYRNNSLSRTLEEALTKRRIPYKIVGGVRFYERKEIKDLVAYLKLIANPNDDISFKRVVNVPKRAIGTTTINRLDELARLQNSSLFATVQTAALQQLNANAQNKLLLFVGLVKELQAFAGVIESASEATAVSSTDVGTGSSQSQSALSTLVPVNDAGEVLEGQESVILSDDKSVEENKAPTVSEILDRVIMLTKFTDTYMVSKDPTDQARLDNIQELVNIAHEFSDENESGTLMDFLERISLYTDLDQIDVDDPDFVSLMTLHSSKGLEFGTVYIIGLEEGLLPAFQSMDNLEDVEEERRLFYVGITRAKNRLVINLARSRYRFGKLNFATPSRFLKSISETSVNLNDDAQAARFDLAGFTSVQV